MGKVTLVIGGASSGKSQFALELAKRHGVQTIYLATARASDAEMRRKISVHRRVRPNQWKTIEAGSRPFQIQWPRRIIPCLLLDGLTLWVSTSLLRGMDLQEIRERSSSFINSARKKVKQVIIVSDEVGNGIVPGNRLARRFIEILGKINQDIGQLASDIYWIVAGFPVQLKGKM